jgi:hypothetical protein
MFRCAGQAGGGPLMSNVRPHFPTPPAGTTPMQAFCRLSLLVTLAVCVASCATPPYVSPTLGPVAYLRVLHDDPKSELEPALQDNACNAGKNLPRNTWVTVPANRKLHVNKWYAFGTSPCIVVAPLTLAEGERVELRFQSQMRGLSMSCDVTATKYSSETSPLEPFRLAEKQCY